MHEVQSQVIAEFRATAGRVGGPFEGARLLLLTTTGARSGAEHTVPLAYLPTATAGCSSSARRVAANAIRRGSTTWSRTRGCGSTAACSSTTPTPPC